MKQEIANQVNLWENIFVEHAVKQQHNPFSEWSDEHPKKPLTSPVVDYSRPANNYSPVVDYSRPANNYSPAVVYPFGEQPRVFTPQPFGAQSPKPFIPFTPWEQSWKTIPPNYSYQQEELHQNSSPQISFIRQVSAPAVIQPKYFFPPGEPSQTISTPKNLYPSNNPSSESIHPKYFYQSGEPNRSTVQPRTFYPSADPRIHPKYFYPPELTQNTFHPETSYQPEEALPENISPKYSPPKTIPPKNFYPSAEPSPRISNPKPADPPKCSNANKTPDFLPQVRKWRTPGSEVKELTPLTKIPEPLKPAEPIKVKIPTPWEDPLTGEIFTPHTPSCEVKSEPESFFPRRIERPEYLNWRRSPEKEYFKFSPTHPVKPREVSKVLPGWSPMGKTFADIVGGEQTISPDFYKEDTTVGHQYSDPIRNWDHPDSITQSYIQPSQQTTSDDMSSHRMHNMSGQIKMWQEKVKEHEEYQLINPFSEWEGAPKPANRSKGPLAKTDPEYGWPVKGTKSHARGQKAIVHISNEIIELCQFITDWGERQPDDSVKIKFGPLFQAYTRISNKVVGMLVRARKHGLLDFEGEMLYQRRDEDIVITLFKAMELLPPESMVARKSERRDAAQSSGGVPADIKIPASAEAASATGDSSEEMLSKSESANRMMNRGSSISSSTMSNEESMSMQEESMGSTKMMSTASNSTQMMSKEDGDFSTKMFAGSSNTSNMMSKEENSTSTKMFSESSSSMKMLKEEGSISSQMLGEGVHDSAKMLAGVSISPSISEDSFMSGDIFNSMKMVPKDGNTSLLLSKNGLGTLGNMATSEMMSTQQASSSSMMSKQMSTTSEQMSAGTEQMTSAMENMSMSSAENKQTKMLSSQMSTASEQMSSASEQMSMASEQMSMSSNQMSSTSQMKQVSDISQSSSDMMSSLLDDPFGKMVGTLGSASSIQKSSQQSSSSKMLSKKFSSFESSSNTAMMDETHSIMSSDLMDLKKLT